MSQTLTISAIVPAYNAENTIVETLESLLMQTRRPDEILVVDDGSTDATASIVDKIAEAVPSVRLIRQDNKGETRARLSGLEAATSSHIYFLDSDDQAAHDALERLAEGFIAHPDAAVCYGNAAAMDSTAPRPVAAMHSGRVLFPLLMENFMSIGCGLIRKSQLQSEALNHRFAIGGDLIMWAQLAVAGEFHSIGGEPVMHRRIHTHSISHLSLENPLRYFVYLDWLFDYAPVHDELSIAELKRARRRRYAGSHSMIARQALLTKRYGLARCQAWQGLWLEPHNYRLWLLYALGWLHYVPRKLHPYLSAY